MCLVALTRMLDGKPVSKAILALCYAGRPTNTSNEQSDSERAILFVRLLPLRKLKGKARER